MQGRPSTTFLLALTLGLAACTSDQAAPAPQPAKSASKISTPQPQPPLIYTPPTVSYPPRTATVKLGIDILEAQGFTAIAGKKIGLLSHPAGVNYQGTSTIDVLRRAPNVKLVALFGPEHGIYGDYAASANIADTIDKRTGLPAYSLHGQNRKPTKEQLKGLDALVIDLQDIGVRSYTFSVCMKYAIEACFENNVEVIILDRPNPLGGLKVDGPILDKSLFSGVGQFQIPYVHGLTMGELARMAAATPGWLDVPETVRAKGRLIVIPMSGWHRSMRWPETGLTFKPTSPYIQDFSACIGYAMTGLGCQIGGFKHGIGSQYPFRGLSYSQDGKAMPSDTLLRDLSALKLPGISYRKVALTSPTGTTLGTGIYVEVTDWDDWHPTELSFNLMVLASKYSSKNPFATANATTARSFNIHTGSTEWWTALVTQNTRVDLPSFMRKWQRDAQYFQQTSKKYWLYN